MALLLTESTTPNEEGLNPQVSYYMLFPDEEMPYCILAKCPSKEQMLDFSDFRKRLDDINLSKNDLLQKEFYNDLEKVLKN